MTDEEARDILNELINNLSCYECPYGKKFFNTSCLNGCLIRSAVQTLVDATVKPENAKWEVDKDAYFFHPRICSNCKSKGRAEYKFCPHCGARMVWELTL